MPAITLNGASCVSLRTFFPAVGVWFADVDVDLLSTGLPPTLIKAPSGTAAISIAPDSPVGAPTLLNGTIDANFSGRFAGSGRVRVVGGRGGWDTSLPRQQFAQPGLTSLQLYAATAAAAGELPPLDPTPVIFDEGYERVAGPAARVFGDRPWHVDPITGVVTVTPWLPIPKPPSDLEILGFDPNAGRFEAAASSLLLPGLQLLDTNIPPRWDGLFSVVDVEQIFTAEKGSRASLWVGGGATRLMSALANMVRELSRRDLTRVFRYRVVAQTGATLTLQAVNAGTGAPDSLKVPVWTAPGVSATFLPSSIVLVVFTDGDPGHPRVIAADTNTPLNASLDAELAVNVGPSALSVAIAGGASPLVPTPAYTAFLTALTTFLTGLNATTLTAQASTFLGALPGLPPSATTKTKAT